jgi:hypothetical protein
VATKDLVMRKILAILMVALATLFAAPVMAADIPEYPDIEIPEVDYDLGDSFYLRGSAALNIHWAREVRHPDACACTTTFTPDSLGYGYSWGVGFGYETGTGLRFDGTIDVLETQGLGITKVAPEPNAGKYTLMLRSTIALANVYYDFSFGDFGGYGGSGGAFGYVGVGAGVSYNQVQANGPIAIPTGGNVSAVGAVMAGVGYDMGTWVADVGYRGLYIPQVSNAPTANPNLYYNVNDNFIHELRGTVRYRFN